MLDKRKIYTDWLKHNGIDYIEINPENIDSYKQEWFEHFIPMELREEAINCYCFDKDGYCGYLWHIFSYELLKCNECDQAILEFNATNKHEVILLANIGDVAFQIKDASKLLAEDINKLQDVILTAVDFSWTYAKTHEADCGPYFHSACQNR